jgi:hypothetical protein
MADYSQLNGYLPVTSSTNRVWKVQKKRKAGDRQRQNGKNDQKRKKEEEQKHVRDEVDVQSVKKVDDGQEMNDYGTSGHVKKKSLKVDVKI